MLIQTSSAARQIFLNRLAARRVWRQAHGPGKTCGKFKPQMPETHEPIAFPLRAPPPAGHQQTGFGRSSTVADTVSGDSASRAAADNKVMAAVQSA